MVEKIKRVLEKASGHDTKIVAVSGGFDPVHSGHISLFRQASAYGLVVAILNSDRFLIEKKGYAFYPYEERAAVLCAMKYIFDVIPCLDHDQTVCKTLAMLGPDYFANAGDRKKGNVPEDRICDQLGIKMLYFPGTGGHSSDFFKKAMEAALKTGEAV